MQAELLVPGAPDLPIQAFGSLWLITPDTQVGALGRSGELEPSVARIDPKTNEVVATIPVGGLLCQGIGATEDAIWACGQGGLLRIDPESNEVTATVEMPLARVFTYLPFADGAIWALGGEVTLANRLARIDPTAHEIVETYDLGFDAEWISQGEGALWLSDTTGGRLWRFDPATAELTEHVSGLPEPGVSAVGAGSIWLAVNAGDESRHLVSPSATTLVRIDPETGDVEAEIATGGTIQFGLIHASERDVWVRAPNPFLVRVDALTNEVADRFHVDQAGGGSLTAAYGSLWVTSYAFGKVWRLQLTN